MSREQRGLAPLLWLPVTGRAEAAQAGWTRDGPLTGRRDVFKSVLTAFAPNNGAASSTPVGARCDGCDQVVVYGDHGFILDSAGVTVWHYDCYLEAAEITLAVDWVQRRTNPATGLPTHSSAARTLVA